MTGPAQRQARLRNGRWNAIDPHQSQPYGPRGRRVTVTWAAKVSRWLPDRGNFEFDTCMHNHFKKAAANACATRLANRLNRATGGPRGGTP